MAIGRTLDQVVGGLSRFLHLRAARENTVGDLGPYFDLTPAQLFPAPAPLRDMVRHQSLLDRALHTTALSWKSTHEILCPRYQLRHDRDYHRNHTAYARLVRPPGKRRRTALVYVHGWLEPGSWVEEATLFRQWKHTIDADFVHIALPFHGQRSPAHSLFSGELFWTADLVRSMEGVRQAVCDTRALIDWLRAEGYDRVGVAGLSLGGALVMLLACLEPAPDFAIPIIGHLQLQDVVENAPILWRMKHDLEGWGVHESQRRELFRRVGLSAYTPVLAPERQLWIEARDDVYIDAALVEAQWERWHRPHLFWLPGGHMTIVLNMGAMTRRMADFINGVPPGAAS